MTGDNVVNSEDLTLVDAANGRQGMEATDLNKNGVVNDQDFTIVLNNLGARGD